MGICNSSVNIQENEGGFESIVSEIILISNPLRTQSGNESCYSVHIKFSLKTSVFYLNNHKISIKLYVGEAILIHIQNI